ncbi:MAG: ATP-binding cassette domain-containing protein [Planctomycetia bacterium]|nr:ATP-binding cassette domain-containing protein [Planctomycetia bacterium]
MLEVKNLKKTFRSQIVLANVTMGVQKGEVVALIGPHGAGKSVLLQCLNYLVRPDEGLILVDGTPITGSRESIQYARRKIGMVFHKPSLFPHLRVVDNLMLAPCYVHNVVRKKAYLRCMKALDKVGLAEKAEFWPRDLTPGQQQRVAIARALVGAPGILVLDDPVANLDLSMRGEVLAVSQFLAQSGMTILFSSQNAHFSREIATRVLYLDEGTIYEEGSPQDIFDHPVKAKTARFINHFRSLTYNISSHLFDRFELIQKLREFCYRYGLSATYINKCQTVLEKLPLDKVFSTKTSTKVVLTLEFSETSRSIAIILSWVGSTRNIFDYYSDTDTHDPAIDPLIRGRHFSCDADQNVLTINV